MKILFIIALLAVSSCTYVNVCVIDSELSINQ